MLTLQERRQSLLFLHYLCNAKLLPAEVNIQQLELHQVFHTAGRAGWISKVFYALFAANALYKNLSLVYLLLFTTGTPLHQIMIHAVLAVCCGIFVYWYFILYIQHPFVHARILHMTMTGNIGKSKINYLQLMNFELMHGHTFNQIAFTQGMVSESLGVDDDDSDKKIEKKPGFHRFVGRSMQELIAICLPGIGVATVSAIGACFLYDPGMRVLLYSALPENCKNWFSFCVCWLEDFRLLWMCIGIAAPVLQLEVIAFDLLNYSLPSIVGKEFTG